MRIYVGNLSFQIDDESLRTAFAEFGDVEDVHVMVDRDTGRSRGFGFVTMPDDANARAAMESMDGTELEGRALRVNEAQPREQRGGGRGGDRGGSRW